MYLQDSEKASPFSHSTCTLCRVQNQPNPTNFQKFKIKNNLNTPSKEPYYSIFLSEVSEPILSRYVPIYLAVSIGVEYQNLDLLKSRV